MGNPQSTGAIILLERHNNSTLLQRGYEQPARYLDRQLSTIRGEIRTYSGGSFMRRVVFYVHVLQC